MAIQSCDAPYIGLGLLALTIITERGNHVTAAAPNKWTRKSAHEQTFHGGLAGHVGDQEEKRGDELDCIQLASSRESKSDDDDGERQ